jgi:hypothetical protein
VIGALSEPTVTCLMNVAENMARFYKTLDIDDLLQFIVEALG